VSAVLAPPPTRDLPPVDDEALVVSSPPGPDRAARLAAIAAVLALIAGALALPAGSLLGSAPFATLIAGSIEVREAEGWRTVNVGGTVEDGDELRAAGGLATLEIGRGRLVLGPGAGAAVDGGRLLVERGSVLVDDPAPRTLVVAGVATTGVGAWRVDVSARPRLATYDGTLEATDGRVTTSLPAYRQITVRDRALGGAPAVPLRYSAADRFDVVRVAEALRTDTVAASLGRSLSGTYGEAAREAAFYGAFVGDDDAVLPALGDLAPTVEDDRFGPPAPVLLGIAVAEAVAALADRPLAEAVEHVVTLRAEGAAWGLLLLEAGGGADELSTAAERGLDEAAADPPPEPPTAEATDVTAATEGAPATGTPTDAGAGGGSASTGGSGGDAGSGGGAGTAPALPRPDPSSGPTPTPTPTPVPTPTPRPPVSDAVDEVGSTVGDLLDGVGDAADEVVSGVTRGNGNGNNGNGGGNSGDRPARGGGGPNAGSERAGAASADGPGPRG
jgi:hypothetical protein